MNKLPEQEVQKRIQEWRNYKNILYPNLKEKNGELKIENINLKNRNKELELENKQIEKLQLQLEELRTLKFGKKRNSNKKSLIIPSKEKKGIKQKRSKESYRRPEPESSQITDNLNLEIEVCPDCGEKLIDKKQHIHYREDLKNIEQLLDSAKQIVETIVESGRCPKCKKRQAALEIPKQKVILGQNIRSMVVYQAIVQGQSYSEVLRGLSHQYGIKLSNGEIANILEGESKLVSPYYNHLYKTLLDESNHYDETTWNTQSRGTSVSEGNYCWVKISTKTENRIIWFGRSRGKKVAEDLRGPKENSIGVSDDYGSYRNLFDHHQLCWAHPIRKLRDLAESKQLKSKTKKACQKAYKDFKKVYKRSQRFREEILKGILTDEQKEKELAELKVLFAKLFEATSYDPEKLITIRESLQKRKDRYFTFSDYPELPLDNNKAERAIRKIVLKRKKSFGSKSVEGANTLSILYSVIFSILESNPDRNFFELYNEIIDWDGGQ